MKYIGGTEDNKESMTTDVSIRLQRMAAAYSKLSKNLFENKDIKLKTKMKTFESIVLSK